MSMHQIEDLVEETVHLIDTAGMPGKQKRTLLSNLFAMQSWYFDTSYTHFRVIDILLKYRFVYKIHLPQYPELPVSLTFLHDNETQGWMKMTGSDDAAGYAIGEDLYFDAGSTLWQQLCGQGILSGDDQHPPDKLSVLQLINTVLEEAEKQQSALLPQWYALLVNAILAADFSAEDGIPPTFNGFLHHEVLNNIRAIAQRNNLPARRRGDDDDDYLALPALEPELEIAKNTDEAYKLHFLLDLKKTTEALAKAYAKASKAAGDPATKIDLVFQLVNAYLSADNWAFAPQEQPQRWLWYKDIPTQARRFIILDLDVAEKTLFCKQAIQHVLLLKWQRREPDTAPWHFHFYRDIVTFLPDEWMDKNEKNLSKWGGWKYDIGKPESTLKKSIDNLIAALDTLGNTYFDFLHREFPGKFFARGLDELLYTLENGEGEMGIIPEYVLFDSKYHILLAFALHYSDKGDDKEAGSIIERAREIADAGKINMQLKEKILSPVFAQWAKNKEVHFPLSWNKYMLDHLKQSEPE